MFKSLRKTEFSWYVFVHIDTCDLILISWNLLYIGTWKESQSNQSIQKFEADAGEEKWPNERTPKKTFKVSLQNAILWNITF